jgi:hypothetical protein
MGVRVPHHQLCAAAHHPITDLLVRQLNPELPLEALMADLVEIDYPRKAN